MILHSWYSEPSENINILLDKHNVVFEAEKQNDQFTEIYKKVPSINIDHRIIVSASCKFLGFFNEKSSYKVLHAYVLVKLLSVE